MSKPYRCIIVAEGESDGQVFEFATIPELDAFKDGVWRGSEKYGAGGCGAYSRSDLADLDPGDKYDRLIIDRIIAHLSE